VDLSKISRRCPSLQRFNANFGAAALENSKRGGRGAAPVTSEGSPAPRHDNEYKSTKLISKNKWIFPVIALPALAVALVEFGRRKLFINER